MFIRPKTFVTQFYITKSMFVSSVVHFVLSLQTHFQEHLYSLSEMMLQAGRQVGAHRAYG